MCININIHQYISNNINVYKKTTFNTFVYIEYIQNLNNITHFIKKILLIFCASYAHLLFDSQVNLLKLQKIIYNFLGRYILIKN